MSEDNPLPTNIEEREEAARLYRATHEARVAYHDHELCVFEGRGGQGECLRCAKSGIPIVDGDEYVEDLETGETFLRAALGLAPRAVEEVEDDEDPDDIDQTVNYRQLKQAASDQS